ncbi:homeodomain-like containing protein [Theileria orientalis strain Shintoku]|uniref:Homeodomain-like containing protein n=1 Tax=Theileria orientalis strain Shintoku TaxID=869250 RepID=J4D6U8_THEOR|nr:homeodomain-like containing protein [Theileria orientalis strain Shintoku]BAM39785.1 homeodomain-like containing protein [Theileria orientalis strain Shintoku]|eukprot:XP_009690086.1 homeodomain-like containing protein [Theileria orientalis strain Shintoku]
MIVSRVTAVLGNNPNFSSLLTYRNFRIFKRALRTSPVLSNESQDDLGPPIRRPRKYLDMKTFRKFLKQQKTLEIESEKREISRSHAKKPPEGWDVVDFLKAIDVGDGVESIAESFESWNDFISSTPEELYANTSMTNKQRRKIIKYISLYNHGLWPKSDDQDYVKAFQAPALENEGKPWDEESDRELLRLAEYYHADFGDPWLYISWDMQRTIEDVQDRYTEIAIKPKYKNDKCDFGVTRCHQPLLMNRKFKMCPPFLYIVPSEENFPLAEIHTGEGDKTVKEAKEVFSPKFLKYRNPSIF